jgi:glyoxylase-like metal-dependent hydrolase (beta-lactamase superfamily II)
MRCNLLLELKNKKYEVFPLIVPDHSGLKSINFYLVKSSQSLILIDAGLSNNDCFQALVDSLNINDLSISDLTDIILTHHHIDHVGLVNRITSTHPIPVYVHSKSIPRLKRDDAFLKMRVDFFSSLYEQMGCGEAGKIQINYLKQAIKKNKELAINALLHPIEKNKINDFDIIEVPGHAPDQIALFEKTSKWLFSGDLLINHISSNALIEPNNNGERIYSLIEHMNSLKKCLPLPIELVFPGHGTLINQPIKLIQKRLNGIEEKAERLMTLIREGIGTGNELAQTYYKNKYEKQFSLVMSEIIGHLDYLEVQGRIHKKIKEGVWHYST